MSPQGSLLIELDNDMGEIHRLVELTEEYGQQQGIPRPVLDELHLILEEVVANVISYGLRPNEKSPVYLTIRMDNGTLTMQIEDRGVPFNPLDKAEAVIDSDVEDRPIGGLGIYLTRKLMDGVEYRREQDRNVLLITKRIHTNPTGGAKPLAKGGGTMEVTKEQKGTALIVRISGRLDILNSKELGNELQSMIDAGHHYLALDLSGLEYVSSSGLRVLLQARKTLKPLGGTVVLCAMTDFVRKVIDTTGFASIFKAFPTVEEALAEAPAG